MTTIESRAVEMLVSRAADMLRDARHEAESHRAHWTADSHAVVTAFEAVELELIIEELITSIVRVEALLTDGN